MYTLFLRSIFFVSIFFTITYQLKNMLACRELNSLQNGMVLKNIKIFLQVTTTSNIFSGFYVIICYQNVSNFFLTNVDFKGVLSSHFVESVWLDVEELIEERRKKWFKTCIQICIKDCRSCFDYGKYFHFKCAKISQYHRNTLSPKWKCGPLIFFIFIFLNLF